MIIGRLEISLTPFIEGGISIFPRQSRSDRTLALVGQYRICTKVKIGAIYLGGLMMLLGFAGCSEDENGGAYYSDSSANEANTIDVNDTDTGAHTDVHFHVAVELSSAIETVAIVAWSRGSDGVGEATIDFGRTGEDWEYEALVDENDHVDGTYRTRLVGMKQNTAYRFRIIADGAMSDEYTLTTGYVPNNLPPPIVEWGNAGPSAAGFIVTATWTFVGGGTPVPYIMDNDGDIVWSFAADGVVDITAARLSYDGQNMWMVPTNRNGEMGAVFRVSIDGLETETFDVIGASQDIFPVKGETMAFIDFSGNCCKLQEVKPGGSVHEVYDLGEAGYTDCNCNAMRYSESESLYVVSEMTSGDYVAFDRSGDLKWASTLSDHHHGCHLTDDSLLVFFNPDTIREYAVSEFGLGLEIWRYTGSNGTLVLGDVQRLPGGNTMITYSDDAVIHEVDSASDVVKTITFDDVIGFAAWRKSLYEAPPDVVI